MKLGLELHGIEILTVIFVSADSFRVRVQSMWANWTASFFLGNNSQPWNWKEIFEYQLVYKLVLHVACRFIFRFKK
jgi:hypothetical protein